MEGRFHVDKLSGSICVAEKADGRDWRYPGQSRWIVADMSSGTGTTTCKGQIQAVLILVGLSITHVAIIRHELCTVNCS